MLSDTTSQSQLTQRLVIRAPGSLQGRLPAFLAAAFLVSVPVFIQAPLVRLQPWVSLALSLVWLFSGLYMLRDRRLALWGDIAVGFTWTWLAGSIYWGWFRAEPLIHLPVEALGLPFVAVLLFYPRFRTGSFFYLGSLLGTALTDAYFYWVDLIPYWREVMTVDPDLAGGVLHAALLQIENPVAMVRAMLLLGLLIILGTLPMASSRTCWWAFSGAVLSTILVDALFLLAAVLA